MAVDPLAPFRLQLQGVASPHGLKRILRQLQRSYSLRVESITAADWQPAPITAADQLVAEHVAALKIGWAPGTADLVLEAGSQRLLLVAGDGD